MAGISSGADGSIHIDTKIDESGINQGAAKVEKAAKKVAKETEKAATQAAKETERATQAAAKAAEKNSQRLKKSFGGILNIIKGIGKALIAAFIGGAIIGAIRNIVQEFDLLTGSSGEKFKALSGVLETLKGVLVNLLVQAFVPLIPYLIDFVNWLIVVFQTVTQIVAALFGFESTVGGIMTKAASGAQKAAKEAKGALAAFDQINVLQQPQGPETPEGATVTPGPMKIDSDILDKVQTLLKLWDEFLKDPMKVIVATIIAAIQILSEKWREFVEWVRNNLPFGNVIADILTIIGETIKKLFINFIETVQNVKKNVELIFKGISDFIKGVIAGDWQLAFQGLVEIVGGVFGVIFSIIEGVLNHIGILLDEMVQVLGVLFAPVLEWLSEMFERIRVKVTEAIEGVTAAFGSLAKWFFENVWNPVEAGFGSMLTGIKQGFEATFNGIKTFVKGVINTIIDFINGMIEGVVYGINSVIGAANAVAGIVGLPEIASIDAPKIPKLATGAVIPPNSEFLAILGDQRSGRNIEAPEGLIRQIMREELSNIAFNAEIEFTGRLSDVARILAPEIKKESVRVGNSLLSSGVTRK